jgi:hypothetical protein
MGPVSGGFVVPRSPLSVGLCSRVSPLALSPVPFPNIFSQLKLEFTFCFPSESPTLPNDTAVINAATA